MAGGRESERRLAAIMITDVVGYTQRMQHDEAATLRQLEAHQRLLRAIFPRHHGHEIKTMGDGFLVEFASALEATRCAIEIQTSITSGELASEGLDGLALRIGIHVGDVEHRDGDLIGDAVNLASRIEPLAEPGTICITRQVYDQVRRSIDARVVSIGRCRLKHVDEPLELFRIVLRAPGSGRTKRHRQGASRNSWFLSLGAAGLLIAIGGLAWWGSQHPLLPFSVDGAAVSETPRIESLAVLPFVDLSSTADNEYFCDGLSEELITALSKIEGLKVIGRTSSFAFKGQEVSLKTIGHQLGVQAIVEGSVRKEGNQLRITAQLVNVADERHLWAETYDRGLGSIFAVQEEIAQRIVASLPLQLAGSIEGPLVKPATTNLDAYDLYLLGRWSLNKGNEAGFREAIDRFQQAVGLDGQFALAYAGLADAYNLLSSWGYLSPQEAAPLAQQAALKAVSLDPTIAEPYVSLGVIKLLYDWDVAATGENLRRAIEINPGNAEAHLWYALHLSQLGQVDEAVAQAEEAVELDPLSYNVDSFGGIVLLNARRFDEAITVLQKGLRESDGQEIFHGMIAAAYMQQGKLAEAKVELQQEPHPACSLEMWAIYYAKTGQRAAAEEKLAGLIDGFRDVAAYQIALVYFVLGERDLGFQWLQTAYDTRDAGLIWLKVDPFLDDFRDDPRYAALLSKLGLQPGPEQLSLTGQSDKVMIRSRFAPVAQLDRAAVS